MFRWWRGWWTMTILITIFVTRTGRTWRWFMMAILVTITAISVLAWTRAAWAFFTIFIASFLVLRRTLVTWRGWLVFISVTTISFFVATTAFLVFATMTAAGWRAFVFIVTFLIAVFILAARRWWRAMFFFVAKNINEKLLLLFNCTSIVSFQQLPAAALMTAGRRTLMISIPVTMLVLTGWFMMFAAAATATYVAITNAIAYAVYMNLCSASILSWWWLKYKK